MYINTRGLILREAPYKESSRILTVLTAGEGRLTVTARGVKRRGSKNAAGTQVLAFSDMTLFSERGRYTLTESRPIELFEGLRRDVSLLSLGAYFAELLEELSDEGMPEPEILSLGLNALYALSEGKRDAAIIKAAFEMRLMCLAGYEPALSACAECGREDVETPAFDLTGGVIRCLSCAGGAGEGTLRLSAGCLAALRHIVRCDPKRLYSFTLSEAAERELSRACEAYLLTQLSRDFRTLDFYRSLKV